MVSTDGRTDGRTDTEGYNIIPRHTLVAGYKKHKATKPALNVGPLAIRWRADVGQHIVVFGSSLLSTTKKTPQSWTPLAKLSGSAHEKITF